MFFCEICNLYVENDQERMKREKRKQYEKLFLRFLEEILLKNPALQNFNQMTRIFDNFDDLLPVYYRQKK